MANDFSAALKKLEKEKVKLTSQLSDINTAIESLQRVTASLGGEVIVSNVEVNLKREKITPYSDYVVMLPSRFSTDLTLPEMLIFAINAKNGAFAHDAAEFIHEINPNVDLEMLKRRFTEIASAMARAGKLGFKKIGKKYRYLIREENGL